MRRQVPNRLDVSRACRRQLVVLAALVVVGALAAASGTAAPSATKPAIKVLAYGDQTLPPPFPARPWLRNAVVSTVDSINAKGGINGARIALTWCDTKLNVNDTLACVRNAADYDAVIQTIALLGDTVAAPVLQRAGVPVFASSAGPGVWNIPNVICSDAGLVGLGHGLGYLAKRAGVKKLAINTQPVPITSLYDKWVGAGAAKYGVQIGTVLHPPAGTVDPTPSIVQSLSNGEDGIFFLGSGGDPSFQAGVRLLKQRYPGVKIIVPYYAVPSTTLADLGSVANGIYVAGLVQPLSSNTPGAKAFVAASRTARVPSSDVTDTALVFAQVVRLFEGVAKQVKGRVTASSLLAAANAAKRVDLGGVTPNYNASEKGKHKRGCVYNNSIVPMVVRNEKLVNLEKPGTFLSTITGKLFTPKK